MKKHNHGFTIVELLIIIVVIAILAAISIIAYNGIQDRTYDSAVQNDLNQIGRQLALYHVEYERYPTPENGANMAEAGLSVTRDAYHADIPFTSTLWNLLYCHPNGGSGNIALVAVSRSGEVWQYSSSGVSEYTGQTTANTHTLCSDAGAALPAGDINPHRSFIRSQSGDWASWLQ